MIYSCAAVHEFELLKRMSGFLPQESVKRIRFHQVPKPNSTFVGSGSGNDGANKNSDNRSSVLREVRSFNPLRIKRCRLASLKSHYNGNCDSAKFCFDQCMNIKLASPQAAWLSIFFCRKISSVASL